jgi:hypothetical protein
MAVIEEKKIIGRTFTLNHPHHHHPLREKAWAEGNGKLATCRYRADSGGEMV